MKHSTTKFRRVMALTLALLLVVGLTGCIGQKDPDPTDAPTEVVTEAPTEKPTEKPTEAPTEKPTEAPEKGVMGTVSANNLNVRSNHASDSAILSQLPVNLRVEILEQKTVGGTNWGRIGEMTLPNGTKIDGGWLNLHYVKLDAAENDKTDTATEPSSGNTTTVDPDEEALGTITAQQLQIRKGAGTTYDTAGSYKKGDRVKVLEQKTVSGTTWGRTEKGWISMSYVKLDGSAGSATDTGTNIAQPGATTPTTPGSSSSGTGTGTGTAATSKVEVSNGKTTVLGYVVVDTKGLTLRAGPGTNYKALGTAEEGDRYPYYQTSNKWYRTSEGWLSNADNAYLYVEGTMADDAAMATILAEKMHVRQGPGTNFKSVTTLVQDEMLVVLGQSDGWGYTRLGWINVDDEYVYLDEELTYTTGDAEVLIDGLNVREKADAESKRLSGLEKGDEIEILELGGDDDNWGKIEYASGKEGWISLSYVKMTSGSTGGSGGSGESSSSTYNVDVTYDTAKATVQVSPSKFTSGTKVTLNVSPVVGQMVDKVEAKYGTDKTVDVKKVNDKKFTFTMPEANVDVTITFKSYVATYDVTCIPGDVGYAIAKVGSDWAEKVEAGTVITLKPQLNENGYEFDKFEVTKKSDNSAVTVNSDNTFTMPADAVNVKVVFKKVPYDIKVVYDVIMGKAETNKSEAGNKAYVKDTVEITLTPETGYKVKSVTYKDAENKDVSATKVSSTKYKFTMPACNTTVTVTFESTT